MAFLKQPFEDKGKIYKPLLLLFLIINLIVLRNAVFHDPSIGYDAWAYYDYIKVLAKGHLPSSQDTPEFFSAPLAFIPSSVVYAALDQLRDAAALNPPNDAAPISTWLYFRFFYGFDDFPSALVGKFTQFLNVVYSLLVTFFLLKICELLRPKNVRFKFFALFLLGLVTAYYRMYAFVRAEPLMLAVIVTCFYALLVFWKQGKVTLSSAVILGILVGLGMLTRQWFLSTALTVSLGLIILMWENKVILRMAAKILLVFALPVVLIAGYFYIHLQFGEGSAAAFAKPFVGYALSPNWTDYFYLHLDELFVDPVRNTFNSQFIPLLYSDTWGDYWAYFTISGRDARTDRFVYGTYLDNAILSPEQIASGEKPLSTNRFTFNAYLGRVNLVSILPSLILLGGFGLGLVSTWRFFLKNKKWPNMFGETILTIFISLSLAIYFFFLIFFSYDTTATIKTGYILHVFPFLAILGSEFLLVLERRMGRAFPVLVGLLFLVAIHNLPAFWSNTVLWP